MTQQEILNAKLECMRIAYGNVSMSGDAKWALYKKLVAELNLPGGSNGSTN